MFGDIVGVQREGNTNSPTLGQAKCDTLSETGDGQPEAIARRCTRHQVIDEAAGQHRRVRAATVRVRVLARVLPQRFDPSTAWRENPTKRGDVLESLSRQAVQA